MTRAQSISVFFIDLSFLGHNLKIENLDLPFAFEKTNVTVQTMMIFYLMKFMFRITVGFVKCLANLYNLIMSKL